MRVIIVDPALSNNIGHHANLARYIHRAAQDLGIPTEVYGSYKLTPDVEADLGAKPLFRYWTYVYTDGDPICGWLNAFLAAKDTTRDDLLQIKTSPDDLVILDSAQPAQTMAMIEWMLALPPEESPTVVIELGGEPGIDLVEQPDGEIAMEVRDPRKDARGLLYRFVAQRLKYVAGRRFHLVSLDHSVSDMFASLMEQPITTMPFPTPAITSMRNRAGKRPITIATLGHQQFAKGFHLMPAIVEHFLSTRQDVRFLVHNSDHQVRQIASQSISLVQEAQQRLRAIAARDPRLDFREEAVDMAGWVGLLEETDLLICPYSAQRYGTSHSGMTAAAIANAIPVVVPAESSLSRWLPQFGEPGVAFKDFTAESVIEALEQVLDNFDEFAGRAKEGAGLWIQTQGAANFLRRALELRHTTPEYE